MSAVVSLSPSAVANETVVVELYTSQACNTCPPADAFLGRLAERADVIAIALHVDYWDYLGWRDTFGSAHHTERQRGYHRAGVARMVFTPQMVIQGETSAVGHDEAAVSAAIAAHAARPLPITLTVAIENGALRIDSADAISGAADVVLFGYSGPHVADITAGENRGHVYAYHNVVSDMRHLGVWDGRAPLRLSAPIQSGPTSYAVVVQKTGQGPILGAAVVSVGTR